MRVYRSMAEFRRHFFPKAVAREEEEERVRKMLENPEKYGTGIVTELLQNMRKRLQKKSG